MLGRDVIIGVCGAGVMGAGIAQLVAQAGHRVIVFNRNEDGLARAREKIGEAFIGQVQRGKLDEAEAAVIKPRFAWTTTIADLAPCGLVIETIAEEFDAKASLLKTLSSVLAADAVLATNTSSLSVSALGALWPRPKRFLGLHFFNPAPVMKLVEVVIGEKTDPQIAADAAALAERWGKRAALVRDAPGFIVNRVARPFYSEGWMALEEGATDAATIDFLYRDLAGFRMGPLELGDAIGHEITCAASMAMHKAFQGRARFRPSRLQAEFVAQGRLGRKAGRGVYDYAVSTEKPAPRFAACDAPVGEEGVCFMQSDGRTAKIVAETEGRPIVVSDFATPAATVFAFAASSEDARRAAISHATRLGKRAVELADRPGLLVFRTLLQLANAAGDAAAEGVAAPETIDLAMLHGVNYPFGPLRWAGELSPRRVVSALNVIAAQTGDEMYRPSCYFTEGLISEIREKN